MSIPKQLLAAKKKELYQLVDQLVGIMEQAVENDTPIHEVETQSLENLHQTGRKAMQLLVDAMGNGDCGETYTLPDGTGLKRSEEPVLRPYISIFGPLHIEGFVYAKRAGQKVLFSALRWTPKTGQ